MRYLIIVGAIFFFLTNDHLLAQTAFVSIGGDIASENGNVSFSVGQTAYQFILGTQGNVIQGVQQPYEIFVIPAEGDGQIDFECKAFPNPTNDLLTLSLKDKALYGVSYQLVSSAGRLLIQNNILSEETTLSMKTYTPAVYFLRLIEDEKVIRTFKIIKH